MYSVAIVGKDRQDAKDLERAVDWRASGCHVTCAWADGAEAWRWLRQIQPDILITEILLSDMSGLDLIRKKNDMLLPTQTIIVTDCADFHCAQKAIEMEVAGYLLRPVAQEEMRQSLLRAVRRIEQDRRIEQNGRQEFRRDGRMERNQELEGVLEEIREREADYPSPVRQALSYIERHLYEPISLTELCDYLGLSPPHVSRIFKEEVGVGYSIYVRMRKMLEAKKLLGLPGNKPGQVAKILGYNNYSYFYQVYKKQFGFGPTARF